MGIYRTLAASTLLALGALCMTAPSKAQENQAVEARSVPKFGAAKVWAFSTDASISIQRRTQSGGGGAVTTITLVPAADYFVIDNLSVGGFVGLDYTKAGDSHGTRFSVGPRVGYDIFFAERWSVWPKVGFSYAYTKVTGGDSQNAIALNVFVPLMFHPVPHFFAGFGPFIDTDLNGDHRSTTWGAKLTLGGWL